MTVDTAPTLFAMVTDSELEGVFSGVADIPLVAKAQVRQILVACRQVVAAPAKVDSMALTKFKLCQVTDQAMDVELVALDGAIIKAAYDRYRLVFGTMPPPNEELTNEQLTAVKALLDADRAPYVDFAVWGPFGCRLAKKLKLHGVSFSSDGTLVPIELAGPPGHDQWQKAYLCLRTALVSWNAVDLGRIDQYAAMVARYCERYGAGCWLQVYQADVRCRGEHMERIRRRGDEARARALAAGGTHAMDPARPWDWVWGEACADVAFWRVELEEPALLALTRGRSGLASQSIATPQSGKRVIATDDAPPLKAARLHVHAVDGNAFKSNRKGLRLCAAFNRGECSGNLRGNMCPKEQSAVHQCSRCLDSAHGAHNCPRTDYPAMKPAPAGKGGGRGRGRGGKGRGKSQGKWQY